MENIIKLMAALLISLFCIIASSAVYAMARKRDLIEEITYYEWIVVSLLGAILFGCIYLVLI